MMTPKGEVILLFFLVIGFIQIGAEGQNITKNLTGTSSFEITFNAFTDSGFIELLTESDIVETDQKIYLKAEVNHITGLDVIGSHCYATPSADPNDATNYTIITDGCADSEYITDITQSASGIPNFTFASRVFRFVEDESDSLYFHCDLTVCVDGDCPLGSCMRKRRRRSTNARISSIVSTGLSISK